jgi:hypothetical protein
MMSHGQLETLGTCKIERIRIRKLGIYRVHSRSVVKRGRNDIDQMLIN